MCKPPAQLLLYVQSNLENFHDWLFYEEGLLVDTALFVLVYFFMNFVNILKWYFKTIMFQARPECIGRDRKQILF